jgi:hypothetical protein
MQQSVALLQYLDEVKKLFDQGSAAARAFLPTWRDGRPPARDRRQRERRFLLKFYNVLSGDCGHSVIARMV